MPVHDQPPRHDSHVAYGSRHLDLGCGRFPRNPFGADHLYAVDIAEVEPVAGQAAHYVRANLVLDDIPFEDDYFDSVSAYDFLEHMPRVAVVDGGTILPFVNLMSEIHRVLKPRGEFYAVTPFFPMESAFCDPTHVNFISATTVKYFSAPHNWAQMYGFRGSFEIIRSEQVNFDYELRRGSPMTLKRLARALINGIHPRAKQHVVWHLRKA